jgi:hypothetical protein
MNEYRTKSGKILTDADIEQMALDECRLHYESEGRPWTCPACTTGVTAAPKPTGMTRRWFIRIEWKPQDCWIGVFWKQGITVDDGISRKSPWTFDAWVCLLPMLPIHFGWKAQVFHD